MSSKYSRIMCQYRSRGRAAMQNILHAVGEYLTPTLKQSNFLETGRLTPEEVPSL